ncbi:amino acid ABC transporter substrate-binding protein (PAAT family) [Hydrogenispora ethanolica]|jgi:putative glutamine transport system substrate-binding protein|uniref:Amino acid ABC transporter substrate-binding protein (PAAT family) n=1 Tax=Hydrogenispora ethanolica TaxID=1082276 RepID=A0A4R1R300_HYDET|nr:transporter substrate-binding domain-containing protein [Hydrogenispora ethanolica]TCL59765.1 amino acid ABC transporter substrate-binding protein (PAAT family) [Hydrogenispora ethanolica]
MKKWMVILGCLVLYATLLLVPCGAASQDTPDIKAIKDRGVLKVGVKVDVPKFGYKDPKSGKIDGFEVDIAKALAKKILGKANRLELQGVTAKTRGPLLDNGEVDLVIATFTITEERKKSYNFSQPYFVDGVGLMVKKSAKIKSLKDLNGKKIGVAQSATSRKAVQEEADKLGVKIEFLEFATYPEIKAALDSGRVDCFSVDTSILGGYMDRTTLLLPERFSPQDYGVASKLGNDGLAALVNETIAAMQKSGQLDKLIKKWKLK